MSVLVTAKWLIVEIQPEMSEFPKLVSNVLTGVCHRSVRTHDDFIGLVCVSSGVRFERHHPATGISSRRLEPDHTLLLHQIKGSFPEMEMENVRFARKQIVANIQPLH